MKLIRFVDVGEGITEGHIQKWLVKDGDSVKEDQTVVQVETDKAVVNVPAPISGTIKINIQEGSTLHIGDSLAAIGTQEEIKAQPQSQQPKAQQPQQPKKEQPAAAPQTKAEKEIIATPSVRKLSHELGIDLSKVTGTGPNGRILENDVRAFASSQLPAAKPLQQKYSETLEDAHGEEVERVPM